MDQRREILMKPAYMSPRLSAYDNVLTDEELSYLWKNHNDMEYYWVSNVVYEEDYAHWTKVLTGPRSAKQEKDDIAPLLAEADPTIHAMWEKFKIVGGDRKLVRIYVNGYTYGTEGYVHRDNPRDPPEGYQWETVLVYCNPRWNMQWGGETIFLEENKKDIFFASLPLPKRIVIFKGDTLHVGRSSSRTCPVMRKTLACKTLKKVIDEKKCAEMATKEAIAANVILRKLGMPPEVRCAALLLKPYKEFKIPHDEVVELIGTYGGNLLDAYLNKKSADSLVMAIHLAALEYAILTEEQPRVGCHAKRIEELATKLKTVL
jgi:hypothetical protein